VPACSCRYVHVQVRAAARLNCIAYVRMAPYRLLLNHRALLSIVGQNVYGSTLYLVFDSTQNLCSPYDCASFPAGFALQAMRLFVGEPVWTPYNRPQDEHPSRAKYLMAFRNGKSVAVA
jgi:hypothetical protein